MSTTTALRFVADVWTSSVDKHSYEHEIPVQLCNYMDAYRNDQVRPGPDLLRATASREEVSRFRLQVGDTVLTKDSEDPNDIGISAYVAETADDFVCGYHLAIARPRLGTHPRYLTWALRSRPVLDHFSQNANGISRYGLTTSGLLAAPIPMDDLATQVQIADFLDDRVARIDQIIAARRSQIATLAELSHRRLVDELLGAGESPLGKAPWFSEGLRTVRLSTVWTVIDCKHRTPTYQETGFPVISPGDVSPGRLDLSRATRFVNQADYDDLADDLRRCRRGDLVYSRNASAGTAAYVDGVEPFTMGQDVCRITSHDANQLYLAYCLNVLTEPQLDSVRVGSTFTRINVDQIKMLTIPMRQLRDQITVAGACDRIADECRRQEVALERANQLLTEYKQSLITAAVTGEIDVTAAGGGIPG